MRRDIYHKITLLLPVALFTLSISSAWGDDGQTPGVPIARLALPTIAVSKDTLSPTQTLVGSKVAETKKMLQDVQSKTAMGVEKTRKEYDHIILEANQYHKIVGDIEAKLQLGTTPANPQLVSLRNKASQQLSQITRTLEVLGALSQEFRSFSQQTQAISSQAQQFLALPGAVDEDHAHIILMRQEIDQLNGKICQILSVMVANIWRQGQWLAEERLRFEDLSLAVESGRFMMSSPRMTQAPREIIALEPISPPSSQPHPKPSHAPKKPSKPAPVSPKKKPSPEKRASQASVTPPSSEEERSSPTKAESQVSPPPTKPLSPVAVESRPKIPSATQEATAPPSPEKTQSAAPVTDYATAANGRSPLGILNADQDIQGHKWYLFSSAQRGLATPSDVIDIVSIGSEESPSKKGEEVKDTLLKLGLKPEQLRVIHAAGGEFDQVGKIYIFGK